MTSKLNGVMVPEALIDAARNVRRKGGKVYLMRPEPFVPLLVEEKNAKQLCNNCNGIGHIGLAVMVGGPFDHLPQGGNGDDSPHPTFIDESWYLQKTNRHKYTCPVCHGSGGYVQPTPRKQELAL